MSSRVVTCSGVSVKFLSVKRHELVEDVAGAWCVCTVEERRGGAAVFKSPDVAIEMQPKSGLLQLHVDTIETPQSCQQQHLHSHAGGSSL